VHDGSDLREIDPVLAGELGKAGAHRRRELVRCRGHLETRERAGPRVEDAEVGEGAADVDAQPEAMAHRPGVHERTTGSTSLA
jgi:hypothetical protein